MSRGNRDGGNPFGNNKYSDRGGGGGGGYNSGGRRNGGGYNSGGRRNGGGYHDRDRRDNRDSNTTAVLTRKKLTPAQIKRHAELQEELKDDPSGMGLVGKDVSSDDKMTTAKKDLSIKLLQFAPETFDTVLKALVKMADD